MCRREGAALSSVSMLNGLVVGGRFMCLQFIEGAGFYVLTRGEILPVFRPQIVLTVPLKVLPALRLTPCSLPSEGKAGRFSRGFTHLFIGVCLLLSEQ